MVTAGGGSARRGPRRLTARQVTEFLSGGRWAAVCLADGSGALRAAPVKLLPGGGPDRIRLVPVDAALIAPAATRGDPVCVVADEFETYEGIRGVILQGQLQGPGEPSGAAGAGGPGGVVMSLTRTLGFTFAGSLPPDLAEPSP